jgi:hypothetical protein
VIATERTAVAIDLTGLKLRTPNEQLETRPIARPWLTAPAYHGRSGAAVIVVETLLVADHVAVRELTQRLTTIRGVPSAKLSARPLEYGDRGLRPGGCGTASMPITSRRSITPRAS